MKPPSWLEMSEIRRSENGKTATCRIHIRPWRPSFWPELWRALASFGLWRPLLFLPALLYLCWRCRNQPSGEPVRLAL